MRKRLSESEERRAWLEARLFALRDAAYARGRYFIADVVTEFLDAPAVKEALQAEHLMWARTAATEKLRKHVQGESKRNVQQHELPGMRVELFEEYVVPSGEDEEGDDQMERVARGVLTVGEHARHVLMREEQQAADVTVLRKERRTAQLMQEAGAGPGERVVDVLDRLKHRH
jgi:hypothetical protein